MNAAQPKTNAISFDTMKERATELGGQAGKGKDTQIKFLLTCLEGGYHSSVDLVTNKHGADRDDATILAEHYVKAQQHDTIFDAKAPNQRKLISTLRTAIKLGQWPKGGPGEPLGVVNSLMTERQKMRKDPAMAKKLDDAANAFLKFARAQLKRDTLIDKSEFNDYLLKAERDLPTATEVLESVRNSLKKLVDGQAAGGTAQDNSKECRDALQLLNNRLGNIGQSLKQTAAKQP